MQASSQTRPEPLVVEHLWNDRLEARFAENVVEAIDTEDGAILYRYDEYRYTDNYSDRLAAAISRNRDYYCKLAKQQEKYAGKTPVEIAKMMLEEEIGNDNE